jgi:uncharacterized protein with HEPN domain
MRRDLVLISEMIDAAEARELVVETSVGDLHDDRIRRDALLWNITVLGEAAGLVSQEIKDRFDDVPWRNPVRLRNRIVHGYWSIDLEIVHTTASDQLESFVGRLRQISALLEAEELPPDGP